MRAPEDPQAWGMDGGWHDTAGAWHEVAGPTRAAIAAALGVNGSTPPGLGADSPVWVIGQGERPAPDCSWELACEDGSDAAGRGELPADLPLGYHQLWIEGAEDPKLLVVSPRRCHLPAGMRRWGWALQLYAVRSASSWGLGDLGDLGELCRWSAARGAGFVMVNPLHAPLPGPPQEPSPYSPSSRVWRSPLYLSVQDVPGAGSPGAGSPGAGSLGEALARLASEVRELEGRRVIDRDALWRRKSEALELLFPLSARDPAFERWRSDAGEGLQRFAVFCALSERHGRPWSAWPEGFRSPERPEVGAFARDREDRVRYHAWLQWLLEMQVDRAAGHLSLVSDLAIGVDPDGADVWAWQECYAPGVRVGAPPDAFNTAGQDWGLVPLNPWRLRTAGFAPWVAALRANLRRGGGLRVDHVMGLFRLWWVPLGSEASQGAYVRYPAGELLDVLALESVRAGAFVVGEDLGTVEAGVRQELERRRVLSSKVAWFEPQQPGSWPYGAMASLSTHDLPTLEGLCDGSDERACRDLGMTADAGAYEDLRRKLDRWVGPAGGADRAVALHRLLSESPCALAAGSLEDAVGVSERPNMPGTTQGWPSWSLALPMGLEDLTRDPRVLAVADALAADRPATP
ncbi:MAG: 4-alpha-glucanotransferase [Acidimicrobiales bacterium]